MNASNRRGEIGFIVIEFLFVQTFQMSGYGLQNVNVIGAPWSDAPIDSVKSGSQYYGRFTLGSGSGLPKPTAMTAS